MGHCWGILRALLGVVLFLGVWFLCVTVVVDHTNMTVARRSVPPSIRTIEHSDLKSQQRFDNDQDLEIHYVSRRRVPFGPDPIHNRRFSKDKKPPGRS